MPASDPMRARIEAFNQARGGGVAVHKAGHGYSLTSQRTGGIDPVRWTVCWLTGYVLVTAACMLAS